MNTSDKVMSGFLAVGVLGIVFCLGGLTEQWLNNRTVICAAEDEVPVEVLKTSYDMERGKQLCIHIDNIKEQ